MALSNLSSILFFTEVGSGAYFSKYLSVLLLNFLTLPFASHTSSSSSSASSCFNIVLISNAVSADAGYTLGFSIPLSSK